MRRRAMFYCQHVLGMGHLIRGAEIARGLAAGGFDVRFLNGGEIAEGFEMPPSVEVINLPPVKSDAAFREIQTADGAHDLEETKEARKATILAEYERFRPDVLIVELFPFGRRKFTFELIPLLERIKADGGRTKVVCSLRDILVSKRDQARFDDQVCQTMNRYFDLLLVHADPRFQRLEETFPRLREIKCPIRYTGFVAQQSARMPRPCQKQETNILVSIGGGRVGYELLASAVEASALLARRLPHRMQLFTGPYLPEELFTQLQAMAANRPQVAIERFTTRFLSYLEAADLSISMAGYNTCMNLLATGARALVYPFTGNGNEEQTIRAGKLEKLGAAVVLHDEDLKPHRLAQKIIRARRSRSAVARPSLDLNGAERTASILTDLLGRGFAAARGGAQ